MELTTADQPPGTAAARCCQDGSSRGNHRLAGNHRRGSSHRPGSILRLGNSRHSGNNTGNSRAPRSTAAPTPANPHMAPNPMDPPDTAGRIAGLPTPARPMARRPTVNRATSLPPSRASFP